MATDLLKAYANERVDLVDFEFLSDSGFQESLRQPNAQFVTSPSGQRSWVLDGFEISAIPATKQVQVDRGRAILGQREGAVVHYGALTVEGDANKIIDMGPLTPSTNYGLYLRFEYVDGDTSSRIFWNPAGTGSEIAQSVATRRQANWSIRIELTSPGNEWLKIATLDNTGTPVVITDERPLFFEGEIHNTYASGWSLDGGGGSQDRNADRQQYGVKDLQGFTAAMRQCIEDIKGRGLRRWWDRDIGGMNLGFDAVPVEDRLQVGSVNTYLDGTSGSERLQLLGNTYLDATAGAEKLQLVTNTFLDADVDDERLSVSSQFYLWHDGTNTFMYFDADDYLQYARAGNILNFVINTNIEASIAADGFRATALAVSSNLGIAPADNELRVGNADFRMRWTGTDPYLYFSSNDYFWEDRSANRIYLAMDGTDIWKADPVGIVHAGLAIDSTLTMGAIADTLRVGDTWFRLYWAGGTPFFYWSSTSYMAYDRGNDIFKIFMEGSESFRTYSDPNQGIAIGNINFKLEWDGTDPFIYFASTADYITHDISESILAFYINGGERFRVHATGIAIGDPGYSLSWDGTDPFIYFDANDYIQYDRSLDSHLFYINSGLIMRTETLGLRVKGLAVSSNLSVNASAGTLRVGDAQYRMQFDGTDPFLYLNTNDYLFYDRSEPELALYTSSAKKHAWRDDKAWMAGSASDPTTVLTAQNDFGFDTTRGMFVVRDLDNAGSINSHQVKGMSNLVHYDGGIVVAGITTVNREIKNFSVKGGSYVKKVFKFTASGEVYHDAGSTNFELWWSIGSFGVGSTVYKLTWQPDLVGAKDFWWTELFVAIEASGGAVIPRVLCRMSWHESEGAADQGVRLVTGQPVNSVNTANLLQVELYCGNPTTSGTFSLVCDMFVVEELYGDT